MSAPRFVFLSFVLALAGCSGAAKDNRACTPTLANWNTPHPHLGPDRFHLRVAITGSGDVYYNGSKTDLASLAQSLRRDGPTGPPDPIFSLETEMGIPCARLYEVRQIMDRELQCGSGGHCDEGVLSVWERMEVSGPVP